MYHNFYPRCNKHIRASFWNWFRKNRLALPKYMVCEAKCWHDYKTKHCPVLYGIGVICDHVLLYFSQMSTWMLREANPLAQNHATSNAQYFLNLMGEGKFLMQLCSWQQPSNLQFGGETESLTHSQAAGNKQWIQILWRVWVSYSTT